jgi:hypothetical protein
MLHRELQWRVVHHASRMSPVQRHRGDNCDLSNGTGGVCDSIDMLLHVGTVQVRMPCGGGSTGPLIPHTSTVVEARVTAEDAAGALLQADPPVHFPHCGSAPIHPSCSNTPSQSCTTPYRVRRQFAVEFATALLVLPLLRGGSGSRCTCGSASTVLCASQQSQSKRLGRCVGSTNAPITP